MRRVQFEANVHAAAIGKMLFGDKTTHTGGLTGQAAQRVSADTMLGRIGINL